MAKIMESVYNKIKPTNQNNQFFSSDINKNQPNNPGGYQFFSNEVSKNQPNTSGYQFFSNSGNGSGFYDGQRQQESDYLNRYGQAVQGQESYTAMNDRIGKELGLGDLRKNAFNLQQMVQNVPTVQTQANRGYDVNENQLQRIIAARTSEIAPAAQAATSQAQFAEGQLGERLKLGQADNERLLQPYQMEGKVLGERLAREATGYTQERQNELSVLLQKMQDQQQLTLAEMQRVQKLADDEKSFERQKELIRLGQQNDMEKLAAQNRNNPITVGAGASVYDPSTGQFKQAPIQPLFGGGSGVSENKPGSGKPMSALDQFITSRGGNTASNTVASNSRPASSSSGSFGQQFISRANQVLPNANNNIASNNTPSNSPLAQYLRARGAMA